MYCIKCGTHNDDNALFCSKCGNAIKEKQINQVMYYKEKSNSGMGVSITGLLFGATALILSLVLLIISTNEKYLHDSYISLFMVLGLLSGIFFVIELVLSIVGTAKKANPVGIIGIISSSLSLLIDIGIVIYFLDMYYYKK